MSTETKNQVVAVTGLTKRWRRFEQKSRVQR